MIQVTLLSPGWTSPNGRGLVYPLIKFRRALRDRGVAWRRVGTAAEVGDCDVLLVDDKAYSARWAAEAEAIRAEVEGLRGRAGRMIYLATNDSTGWDHALLLDVVDLYCKNQLLRDRRAYLRPLYGNRLFTDYAHDRFGVVDEPEERSRPIDEAHLGKLHLGWNSCFGDYTLLGFWLHAAYLRTGWTPLLRLPGATAAADAPRPVPVSCRMTTRYSRATVAWQRRQVADRLAGRVPTDRLGRRAYFAELAASRVVVSPFGFGEINYRDYEAMLAGAALLKPDMAHMETWPDLFRGGETYLPFRWDLEDFDEVLDRALADPRATAAVAAEAQRTYLRHLRGPEAAALFCDHFQAILDAARAA